MDVVMPANFIMPKIVFTGTEDPEAHLTTFNGCYALQDVHGHFHRHDTTMVCWPPR